MPAKEEEVKKYRDAAIGNAAIVEDQHSSLGLHSPFGFGIPNQSTTGGKGEGRRVEREASKGYWRRNRTGRCRKSSTSLKKFLAHDLPTTALQHPPSLLGLSIRSFLKLFIKLFQQISEVFTHTL